MRYSTIQALSLALLALCCASPAHAAPPNVVLIIADDHAWTDYSFLGHPRVETPRIDRLARESVTYTHGYVPSSLCCPSLASIITGLYPHQHKITSNDPAVPPGIQAREFHNSAAFRDGRETMNRFLEAVPTLPRLLAAHGYESLQTGKWWQGDFRRGGFTAGMTRGERHGDDGLDIGRRTMQPIFDFVDASQQAGKPFLVWYAPMMPHTPHTPPERLFDKYRQRTDSPHVARYWAMIEWFDETVSVLLDHLDERGVAENTIVVYLADNGWIQDPEAERYAARSKQSQYDGGLRTPIMVRWPGHAVPRFSTIPVSSIDIVPTILAALGQQPTRAMQGVNLLDEQAVEARSAIFGECFTHNAVDLERPAASLRWRWVVSKNWKMIVPASPQARGDTNTLSPGGRGQGEGGGATDTAKPGTSELYDLARDPLERENVAESEAGVVNDLRAKLDAWWNPGGAN